LTFFKEWIDMNLNF